MESVWVVAVAAICVAAVVIGLIYVRPLGEWLRARTERSARAAFRRQREQLEARFFTLAANSGKPRGLRWVGIEFLEELCFARDRKTGQVTAFAGVNIRFEAIPGGDMEGVEAVGNIRDGSALFHYSAGSWGTGGRTLFNVRPVEAVERFHAQFEPLPEPLHLNS